MKKSLKKKARRAFYVRIGLAAICCLVVSLLVFLGVAIAAFNSSANTANTVEELPVANTVEYTVDPGYAYVSTEAEQDTISNVTVTEEPSEPAPEPEHELQTVIELTEEEFKDFCCIVAAEAGGEPFEGQVAVAAVIINRIQNPEFPDTFYGVITQKGQFATVRNDKIISDWVKSFEDVPEKTIEAVQMALTGEDPTEELLRNEAVRLGLNSEEFAAEGALFFYSPKGCSQEALAKRAKVQVDITLENHVFFKVWPTDG